GWVWEWGRGFWGPSKDARFVARPPTMTADPTRTHMAANKEPLVHPLYAYAAVADAVEGLILVNVSTLIDGNPTNNFLERELTFNPDAVLTGARHIAFYSTYAS